MFERYQDEFDWFQEQHEQDQIQILSDWIDDNDDEVIERIGEENEENFRRILGAVRDELLDATREVLVSELTSEDLSPAVATLLIQASSDKNVDDDLRYIRRNVDTTDKLRTLSEETVNALLSKPRKEEPEYEVEGSLMQVSKRVVYDYVTIQYNSTYDGYTAIWERMTDDNGYSEEEAETFLEPIIENISNLSEMKNFNMTRDIQQNMSDTLNKLSQIQTGIEHIDKKFDSDGSEDYME